MKKSAFLAGAAMLASSLALLAQSATNPSSPRPTVVITGAPYSADETSGTAWIQPSGAQVSQAGPTRKVYRDSLGRERVETPAGTALHPRTTINITDPLAGYHYYLDSQTMVAQRFKLGPVHSYHTFDVPATLGGKQLGTQTIDGLVANGRSTQLGAKVTEFWTSPELVVPLLTKIVSAQNVMTMQKINIVRAEPDPTLFQVPLSYSIVDEGQLASAEPKR